MANALVQVEAQFDLMPDEPPPPSEEDRRLASGFEANVERIALMLRSGIHDNQIIAMRKTNPDRAAHLADLLGVMQKDLRRIEVALREMAVQARISWPMPDDRLCSRGATEMRGDARAPYLSACNERCGNANNPSEGQRTRIRSSGWWRS